jgi:hypothetical protein
VFSRSFVSGLITLTFLQALKVSHVHVTDGLDPKKADKDKDKIGEMDVA